MSQQVVHDLDVLSLDQLGMLLGVDPVVFRNHRCGLRLFGLSPSSLREGAYQVGEALPVFAAYCAAVGSLFPEVRALQAGLNACLMRDVWVLDSSLLKQPGTGPPSALRTGGHKRVNAVVARVERETGWECAATAAARYGVDPQSASAWAASLVKSFGLRPIDSVSGRHLFDPTELDRAVERSGTSMPSRAPRRGRSSTKGRARVA